MLSPPLGCPSVAEVPILATSDGGHAWERVATLPMAQGIPPSDQLSSGGGVTLAAGSGCELNVVIGVSRDGGARWTVRSAPRRLVNCQTGAAGRLLALWCVGLSLPITGPAAPAAELLVSQDGGRTWVEYHASTSAAAEIRGVALTPGRLWLYGTPGTLWSSTDAGGHWRAITPAFPVAG